MEKKVSWCFSDFSSPMTHQGFFTLLFLSNSYIHIHIYIIYPYTQSYLSIYLVSMLSIYLYQSFPSGMSSDISLSVRTHLNIPQKNSTFFSVSLYCLIFFFLAVTLVKAKISVDKNHTGKNERFQSYYFRGEARTQVEVNSFETEDGVLVKH